MVVTERQGCFLIPELKARKNGDYKFQPIYYVVRCSVDHNIQWEAPQLESIDIQSRQKLSNCVPTCCGWRHSDHSIYGFEGLNGYEAETRNLIVDRTSDQRKMPFVLATPFKK